MHLFQVAQQYITLYGKDLIHKLKKELHGDLEDVIVGLMETPPMYDAIQLHKAIDVSICDII